ncbi:hypothetical protein PTKIN_Ptkin14bG0083500 [Pterospermum kingtungense]
MTCWATFGEEITTVDISPSWRCITGPCLLAKSLRQRWGRVPENRCKFPMRGNFDGPGGSFDLWLIKAFEFLPYLSNVHENAKEEEKGGRER